MRYTHRRTYCVALVAALTLSGSAAMATDQREVDEPLDPVPCGDTQFRVEYFDNTQLEGAPLVSACDDAIDFDWGYGRARPQLPEDYFAIRWSGTLAVPEGHYRVTASSDDGMRIFVDGGMVLEAWRLRSPSATAAYGYLDGSAHHIVVEYFEETAYAMARVEWEQVPPTQWIQLPDVPIAPDVLADPDGPDLPVSLTERG